MVMDRAFAVPSLYLPLFLDIWKTCTFKREKIPNKNFIDTTQKSSWWFLWGWPDVGLTRLPRKPSVVIFLWIMLRVLYTSTPEQTNIYLFVLVDLVAYKMNEYVYMHASDNKTKHHRKKNVLFLNYKYYQISLNTAFSLHFIFWMWIFQVIFYINNISHPY